MRRLNIDDVVSQHRRHSISPEISKNAKKFHWDIITLCNYKCTYCYSRLQQGQWGKFINDDTIENVIHGISMVNGNKEVFLLGGEPTLHPRYFNILESLWNMSDVIVMGNITNGNYKDPVGFINNHLKYIDKFYWNITFHPDQVHDVDKFKDTIRYIHDKGFNITVNVLLMDCSLDKNEDIIKYCYDGDIFYYPSFLFNSNQFLPFNSVDWLHYINNKYPPKRELYYCTESDTYNFNDIESYVNGLYTFKDWYCYNDTFSISVTDGKFHHFCTEKMVTVDDINALDCVIRCPLDQCVCPARNTYEKSRTIFK